MLIFKRNLTKFSIIVGKRRCYQYLFFFPLSRRCTISDSNFSDRSPHFHLPSPLSLYTRIFPSPNFFPLKNPRFLKGGFTNVS